MRRRRFQDSDSGLDLLLDTVCNAFGGIIFIALLIVLLPTRPDPSASEPAGRVAASPSRILDLDRARDELAHQERVLDLQRRMADSFITPEAQSQVVRRAALVAEREGLLRAAALQGEDSSRLIAETNRLAQETEKLKQFLRRAQVGLLKLKDHNSANEVRSTRLPRLRTVPKVRFFLVLYDNRVYLTRNPGLASLSLYPNEDDFDVRLVRGAEVYLPKPGRGVPVAEWIQSENGASKLRGCVPTRLAVINICVYPNSIGTFNDVRNAFTSHGYDYHWHSLSAERPLVLSRTTTPAEAQ